MEEADKDPEEASKPPVSENQQDNHGVSCESLPQEEEVEGSEKRMINLQRDLTSVTDFQTAADARESMRRAQLAEARRIRFEQQENEYDITSLQEQFDAITERWAKEKVIPQELQGAIDSQLQLCASILEDKKKRIKDLQQDLKVRDDRFVKQLRMQEEEVHLLIERMREQVKILKKAFREELAQLERFYLLEIEVLITRDKTECEQHIKTLCDKELERLTQRKKTVAEYEATLQNLYALTTIHSAAKLSDRAKFQALEREKQQLKATNKNVKLKQHHQHVSGRQHVVSLAPMKSRIISLETEIKNLAAKYAPQAKQMKNSRLSKDYKRSLEQYDRMREKIKHFAVANARKFEQMWLMLEEETKQLVERALAIDLQIYKYLGVAWERPSMPFMERSGPIQLQTLARQADSRLFQTGRALQCSQGTMDGSDRPRPVSDAESTDVEMCKEGAAVLDDSHAEVEEGMLSMETLKKVMELLCDDVGCLMEDKLLKLLAPPEEEEHTVVKLRSLFSPFGIEEEDVAKLALFFLKYAHQQREQMEDVCSELGESSSQASATSVPIHSNHVLPALRSFLKQHMKSRKSQQTSLVAARDSSADKAYWESMGNIITEDKVKLWRVAESKLKEYLAILTENSELETKNKSLKQQNAELRKLLQQPPRSKVNTDLEMP